MRRMLVFASRNALEMLRDPLNLCFGIGFPLVLLLLLTAIQSNIPVSMFELDTLTPGIALFGLSFVALFSATLISRDRSSSFLMRLFASPMTAGDFIFGYTLPLLPMSAAQSLICYGCALALGMTPTVNIFAAVAALFPADVFFIGTGLLCGSLLSDRQVGGLCGALLTNLTAWLSGTWFDLSLVSGTFKRIAEFLPFSRAVDAGRAALSGNFGGIMPQLWWVIGWAAAAFSAAVLIFGRKMKNAGV